MSDGLDIDDSIDINLRPVDEIVRRAVLLITLLRRAAQEESDRSDTDERADFERETDRFELYSWAQAELATIWNHEEQAMFRTPAGKLSQAELGDCLDAMQPASALCWALGVIADINLPDDREVDPEPLLRWAPEPWSKLDRLVRKSSLRSQSDIANERERWELWYWRATVEEADLEPDEDVESLVADVALVLDEGMIESIDGDFAVDGAPFQSLSPDRQAQIGEIANAYLLAINWVCGFGESWSDVPLYPD